MADFVAVIRRAVDGLANNTPEMRIRVYEKARGAVQRQLENMKPRPTDDMLRRQMEKLEAAIREVEAEHAEALPPLEEPAPVAAAAFVPQPAMAPVVPAQPYAAPEPAYVEPEPEADQSVTQPAHAEEEVAPSFAEPEEHMSRSVEPAPAEPIYADPAYAEPVYAEPAYAESTDVEPAHGEPAYPEPADEAPAASSFPASAYQDEVRHDAPVWAEPDPTASERVEDRDRPVVEPAYDSADHDWHDAGPAVSAGQHQPDDHLTAPFGAAAHFAGPDGRDTPFGQPPATVSGDPFADDEPAYRQQDRDDAAFDPALTVPERPEPPYPAYEAPARPRSLATPVWPDAPSTAPSIAADPFEVEQAPERHDDLRGDQAGSGASWDAQPVAAADDERAAADPYPSAHEAAWPQAQGWTTGDDRWPQAQAPDTAASTEQDAHQARFDDREAADLFDAHFDEPARVEAKAEMPAVSDLPDYRDAETAAPSAAEHDPLATYLQPVAKPAKTESQPAQAAGAAAAGDPWNDLEQLIGYDRNGAAKAGRGADTPPDEEELARMTMPARPYRVQAKPKRSYGKILLAVVGLALLAGGGFAVWKNRAALDEVIDNVAGDALQPPVETAKAPAAGEGTAAPAAPAATNGAAQAPAAGSPAPDNAGPTKFTQRLLANGTEVDEGPGGPSVGAPGQSIAEATAPAAGDAATTAATPPAPAPAPSAGAAAQPAAPAAASGEKIFLYEEKIGQSSLTSIAGTVTWSLQSEAGDDGKPQPVVQGRITVPERGMTALITFKRNTDASLPASHLVEFVFSLPPNFEGGSIESVQRISMKQSEQDRGDPLVAVPAKITPDFHMIALNDFPDARARNMELLKSRNWMDVPIIYGTGRRALLTLQKGPEGIKAFDEAIKEWAALSPPQGQ